MAWVSLVRRAGVPDGLKAGMSTSRSRGNEVRYADLRSLLTCRMRFASLWGAVLRAGRASSPRMRTLGGPSISQPGGGVGLGVGLGVAVALAVPNRWGRAGVLRLRRALS